MEPGECGLLWNRVLMSPESGPQRLAHQHTRASLCSDCGFVWLGPAKLLFGDSFHRLVVATQPIGSWGTFLSGVGAPMVTPREGCHAGRPLLPF
ncbi:hypothetical protein TorRG33x02_171210 [Trema orientale]|uniref:Uncharacterized protein n=1 Tax=Trema orientale TaxID=63057 RepID=A0A2P5ENU5_TREOI|nr:hypothetical protein TorRG33x02_171210 [Trema orientale]